MTVMRHQRSAIGRHGYYVCPHHETKKEIHNLWWVTQKAMSPQTKVGIKSIIISCSKMQLIPSSFSLSENCSTVAGPTQNLTLKCIFPFKDKIGNPGIMHDACTRRGQSKPSTFPWCTTKVDENRTEILGHRGECGPGCPIEEGCLDTKGAKCIFPFTYGAVTHQKCTIRGNPQPYCSIENDQNGNILLAGLCSSKDCPYEDSKYFYLNLQIRYLLYRILTCNSYP